MSPKLRFDRFDRLESARDSEDTNRCVFRVAAEIEATLYATAVNGEELDDVMGMLDTLPGVSQAFCNSSVED